MQNEKHRAIRTTNGNANEANEIRHKKEVLKYEEVIELDPSK